MKVKEYEVPVYVFGTRKVRVLAVDKWVAIKTAEDLVRLDYGGVLGVQAESVRELAEQKEGVFRLSIEDKE